MSKRPIQIAILLLQLTLSHVFGGDAMFSGVVLDENNAPVSGLGLELIQNRDGDFTAVVDTDNTGAFAFETPPGQFNLYVVFSPLNNIYATSRTLSLVDDQIFTNYVFRVHRLSAHTSGFLKDAGGAGVGGVEIVFTSSTESAYLTTRTDSDGFFEIQLFPGSWTITPSVFDLNARGCIKIDAINFNAVGGDNHLDLVAQRPNLIISGTVIDDEGTILTGVRIKASEASNYPSNGFSTYQETDGSFVLKVFPAWWWLTFELTPDRSTNYQGMVYELNLTAGQPTVTNLVLPALRSQIDGIIVNRSGVGISNATAQLTGTFNGNAIGTTAYTDDKGHFSARLANGDYTLAVSIPGFRGPPAQTISIHNETRNVTLVAIDPTASIVGTLRDDHGAPITNTTVTVQSRSSPPEGSITQTDSDGHYVLPAFSGTWLVSLDEFNLNARKYILPQSSNPQELTLEDGQTITNDLQAFSAPFEIFANVSDIFGSSVTGASVSADAVRDGHLFHVPKPFGFPYLLRVFPGEWVISVYVPNAYKPVPARRIVIGDTSTNLQITALARGNDFNSTLSGHVLDENGAPLSGLDIELYCLETNLVQKTDSFGKFQFALSEGIWSVYSTNTDYLLPTRDIRIAPNTNVVRTLTVRKSTANLVVHLSQPVGGSNDIEFANVYAQTRAGFDHFDAPDLSETSSTKTLGVFPGEWVLYSYYIRDAHYYRTTNRTVIVPPGGLSIDLDLPPITASIRGKVVDESGAPVPLINLSVSPYAGTDTVDIAPDGSFDAAVPEGRYEVRATSEQNVFWRRFATVLVDVGRGETRDVGSIVVPKPTANFKLKILGPDGAPLTANLGHGIIFTRPAQTSLSVESIVFDSEAIAPLNPGQWEVRFADFDLTEACLASMPPIQITVQPGDSGLVVQLKALPATPAPPHFEQLQNFDGAPMLRLFSDIMFGLDVESSTDLQTWKYFPEGTYGYGYIEIPPPDPGAPMMFYRAVQTEQ